MENPSPRRVPSARECQTMSNTRCDTHCQMATAFLAQTSILNCSVTLAFHASMISRTSQKRSLKAGGCLAVIARAFRIASNRFLDMNEPNLNGAPTKQPTSPKDQKSVRSGPLIVAMRSHKPSQRRNSP